MSLVPRCGVCAAAIDPYGREGTRCARCKLPCPTCGGDVAYCDHPLRPEDIPDPINLPVRDLGDGHFQVAA